MPGGLGFGDVGAHRIAVAAVVEARLERRHVQAEPFGVMLQLGLPQRPLVLEQRVVHLPVAALVAGAARRLGRLERLGMDRLERHVAQHVAQLARVHVLARERGHGVGEVPPAERALVVGVLDQHERRLGVALDRAAVDAAQGQLGALVGRAAPRATCGRAPCSSSLRIAFSSSSTAAWPLAQFLQRAVEILFGALCATITGGANQHAQQDE